jgi:hypothetical protein
MVLTAALQPAGAGIPSAAEAVRRWWLRVGARRIHTTRSLETRSLETRSREIEHDTAVLILAAVARECRSYTDPRADYPLAETARAARLIGAGQRRAVTPSPRSEP